jgi:hypothetical protein
MLIFQAFFGKYHPCGEAAQSAKLLLCSGQPYLIASGEARKGRE